MHVVIPRLPAKIQSQIVGGVLFGDTKNQQSKGTIKGFPKEKLRTFCSPDDGVCKGQLNVNAGHVSYAKQGDIQRAADFLVQQFRGAAY
jgi:cutinase